MVGWISRTGALAAGLCLVPAVAIAEAPTLSFSQAISLSSEMNGGEDGTSQGETSFSMPLPSAPITAFTTRFAGVGTASIGCETETGACDQQIGALGNYIVWPDPPNPTGTGNPGIGVFAPFTYNAPGGDRYAFDISGQAFAPFFYGPGSVTYTATHFIGGFSGLEGSGSVDGVFTQTFTFDEAFATDNPDFRPTVIQDVASDSPFPARILPTTDQGVGAVGAVEALGGDATVRRADGTVEPLSIGTPIFFGDVVDTAAGPGVDLGFADGTSVTLPGQARTAIDEYVYDPSTPDARGESFLRKLFIFTGELIGPDPTEYELDTPCCDGTGIRGESEVVKDAIRQQILNNPDSPAGGGIIGSGALFTAASPVSLTAYVQTPLDPFELSFDYMFLDPDMSLSVALGGIGLFETTSDAAGLNAFETFTATLDWGETVADLTFTFDGPTGSRGLISSLVAPGLDLLDAPRWHVSEGESVAYVAITDAAGVERIAAAVDPVAPVPGPGAFASILGGLGALGLVARRRRATVS